MSTQVVHAGIIVIALTLQKKLRKKEEIEKSVGKDSIIWEKNGAIVNR